MRSSRPVALLLAMGVAACGKGSSQGAGSEANRNDAGGAASGGIGLADRAGGAGRAGEAGGQTMTGGGAGGTGAAGASGTAPAGSLALEGLTIEQNPAMTISCFVSWTTTVPATSDVDFGVDAYAFHIRDTALTTTHRVLVIGMHEKTAYRIRAVSTTSADAGSAEGMFTTGALPAEVTVPTLTADDRAATQPGWTLTNVQDGSKTKPATIVMYDQDGLPVWYFIHGTTADTRGDVPATFLGQSVLVGATLMEPPREVALSGEVLWNGPPQSTQEEMSHWVGKTSTGNYMVNREIDKVVRSGNANVDDQRLEELTPALDVVWSWSFSEHVTPAGSREDYCHGNKVILDEPGGLLYLSCRFLGLLKLDHATGDVVWRLGGTYDDSLGPGDFTFEPAASQFDDIHDPEIHDDGTMLFYDNGGYEANLAASATPKYHSRVVEYEVDQAKHVATRTFEFPGDFSVDDWYRTGWYSPFWGGAARLANGNVLVTAGVRAADLSTRIFEVTPRRQSRVGAHLCAEPRLLPGAPSVTAAARGSFALGDAGLERTAAARLAPPSGR